MDNKQETQVQQITDEDVCDILEDIQNKYGLNMVPYIAKHLQ